MKQPFVTKEKLEEIASCYATPYYLYDEKGIRMNARELHDAFKWNKGFMEYFAVKATPNPVILKILKDEGCGVDCSSMTELMMAEAVGFSGREIMFSSNVTPAEEFVYAMKLGAIINLDDITHIDYLEKHAGLPETICLRYNPGGDFFVSNQIMDTPGEAKYGFTKQQLLEGVIRLRDKGIKEFGLHSFLASNTLTNEYYPALAKILLETVAWLKAETGVSMSFINLSGGIGIPYHPDDKPNDIIVIAEAVRKAYEDALAKNSLNRIRFCAELGRYMLGPYGCLVATAIHKKDIYKRYIGLDACAVNLMRPAMYGAYHHITVIGKENLPHDCVYDITGSLCENNDKFAIDRKLPEIEIGDRIIIHDTGAHGFAMGYNYNGKLRSSELLLRSDGKVELIRRAETPEDYFSTLDVTGFWGKTEDAQKGSSLIIDDKLIGYLEDLSCLTLSDVEKERLPGDLEKILNYMERLSELDTDGVPERSHPFDNVNAFRDDITKASFDRELILKNAPDRNIETFIAPKTVE